MQLETANSPAHFSTATRRSSRPARGAKQPTIPAVDIVNLTSQLAIMIRSGVDIATGLESAARQCRRPALASVLHEIHESVIGGRAFSEALRQYPKVFSPAYVATVAAGEASGHMADVLDQLAELERSRQRLVRSIRGLLVYPMLLMCVSLGVIGVLLVFVLPRFAELFADYDMTLPWITQALIAVANEISGRWWLWTPLVVLAGSGMVAMATTAAGRRVWDRFLLEAPLVKDVTRTLLIGRSCRLMGMLMESGVPLLDTVQLARKSSHNSLYQELFSNIEEAVVNGRSFASALTASNVVPPSAAEMLTTAEQSGKLAEVSRLVGSYFEEEGENRARQAVSTLEPMITVVMGAVVATVVLAVMLPVFDLSSFAGKG